MGERKVKCGCPSGLGYRFHQRPCRRAGEIERKPPRPVNPQTPQEQETDHE